MNYRATLGSKEKLKSKKAIDLLFKEGDSLFSFPLKLFYRISASDADKLQLKFAITVPKSSFKKAVDRNRLKRVVREAYRKEKVSIYETYHSKQLLVEMIFIYIAKEKNEKKIEGSMKKILSKLEEKLRDDL